MVCLIEAELLDAKINRVIFLGQAKLIISFLFQGFQNSMRVGGHFLSFTMTKILRKQFKNFNNENFVNI